MKLKIIDVFSTNYNSISSHYQAAEHMANKLCDNRLEDHIDTYLSESPVFKEWRDAMPSKTPACLSDFQNKYPNYDQISVDAEINVIGCKLSTGQHLFHGGFWCSSNTSRVLTEPFSTSFCPQIALRNAEFNGKAYDAGEINLFVLKVVEPTTNVFIFRQKNTSKGHEKEVLFSSGATLTLHKKTLIHSNYPVGKWNFPAKKIPVHVIEVDIS
ncbi:hypothetical protein HJ186_23475 [Vibrio parahaemolyticus]|nr:hypothetical protein [Vibrio parahaemolyticus]